MEFRAFDEWTMVGTRGDDFSLIVPAPRPRRMPRAAGGGGGAGAGGYQHAPWLGTFAGPRIGVLHTAALQYRGSNSLKDQSKCLVSMFLSSAAVQWRHVDGARRLRP
eukprot:4919816-Prymnesium_polylepis.3